MKEVHDHLHFDFVTIDYFSRLFELCLPIVLAAFFLLRLDSPPHRYPQHFSAIIFDVVKTL